MGLLNTCWLLLPICFYLGSTADAGKCTGRWAIHACGGGNGKRSDIDYPSLPDEDATAPEGRETEDESRQLDLLTRLTRLSARSGAPAALDARRAAAGQDGAELTRRWPGDELVGDVGREGAELGGEGVGFEREGAGLGREGAESNAEERARLQAALRLIKRLMTRKASMLTNNHDITD